MTGEQTTIIRNLIYIFAQYFFTDWMIGLEGTPAGYMMAIDEEEWPQWSRDVTLDENPG
jgi:hypothetical protein